MKNLIFHGHFYQPPRENPWTGFIEDQREAAPFANWNDRICSEAYEANAFSPLLNSKGQIERLFNNYSSLSFNIGPTLLNWLQEQAHHVYTRIIESDRISTERLGYGNAMAQVYNHIILPLASDNDIKTQIYWGLENFRHHFGRDSEGLWLSETAINPATAAELVRAGVKYTVLSPWQAERIIFPEGKSADARDALLWEAPWTLETEAGELTVFFYHPGLSSDISFNHLLRDADYLFSRVRRELDEQKANTLSIATDGEIYGHHEILGNMGLSAFLNKVEQSDDCQMVNFSWLRNNSTPAGRVTLREEDEYRGSSWSCSHGVSRWFKDCGCSTGSRKGWNQQWRTPLRSAFNSLGRTADSLYEQEMQKLTGTAPLEIRDSYIRVLCGEEEPSSFYRNHALFPDSKEKKDLFFRLLEGQKNKMFMFTSCGWFFADISGPEPVQNMMYAARLIDLYSPFLDSSTENRLIEGLAEGNSNIPDKGNAAALYTAGKISRRNGLYREAASMIVREKYGTPARGYLRASVTDKNTLGLINPLTGEQWDFSYILEGEKRLFSQIRLSRGEQSAVFTPEDLNRDDKTALMKALCLLELDSPVNISRKYSGIINRMDEWLKLRLPGQNDLKQSVEALLHYALREVTLLMENGSLEAWESFLELMEQNRTWQIQLPEELSQWLISVLNFELSDKNELKQKALKSRTGIMDKLIIVLRILKNGEENSLNYALQGRIFEMFTSTEEGRKILNNADAKKINTLKSLLNLSQDIEDSYGH
ncbi:MAG: DUF3536 domain-containing protein [Spirochaetales bacterium]|nr:DUF3536 domain-containing protein [Spirochaetales bacterium]